MFARARRRWSPVWTLSAVLVACGNEGAIAPDNGADDDGTIEPEPELSREPLDAGEPEPEPEEAPRCEVPRFEDDSEAVPFERLEARVVGPDGEPLAGVRAQACGINICLSTPTDSAGRIVYNEPTELQRGAFKYGNGIQQPLLALLLDDEPEHLLGDQITLTFPDVATASPLEPGTTVRSEGVELELAADVDIEIPPFDYDEDERVFVAREFPLDAFPEAVAGQDFVMLVGLGPAHTQLCPPAKLVLPNTAGLPAGRELSLFVQSTDVLGEFAPYGAWAEVSTATVSADGERIETDADQGLPVLGVIGLR